MMGYTFGIAYSTKNVIAEQHGAEQESTFLNCTFETEMVFPGVLV